MNYSILIKTARCVKTSLTQKVCPSLEAASRSTILGVPVSNDITGLRAPLWQIPLNFDLAVCPEHLWNRVPRPDSDFRGICTVRCRSRWPWNICTMEGRGRCSQRAKCCSKNVSRRNCSRCKLNAWFRKGKSPFHKHYWGNQYQKYKSLPPPLPIHRRQILFSSLCATVLNKSLLADMSDNDCNDKWLLPGKRNLTNGEE